MSDTAGSSAMLLSSVTELPRALRRFITNSRAQYLAKLVSGSALACGGLHLLLRSLWKQHFQPYAQLNRSDRISLAEKIISTLHAAFVGLGAVKTVFLSGPMWNDVIHTYPHAADVIYSVSFGYQIYDLITMALQRCKQVDMWAHHAVCIVGFLFALSTKMATFFPMSFLVTELTVVPNNIRWYLRALQTPAALRTSLPYEVNEWARMLSFWLCRVPIGPFTLLYTLKIGQFHKLMFHKDAPSTVRWVSLMFVGLLSLLNVLWSVGVTKQFMRRHRSN
eukprot:TRINITY_DN10777_c0_g1_i1.p1 TRINITY_DN10777_c0_g1~~TRINITY_DN10777_c0_g1_i1.p1  ORF type:complete len:278 (-),score=47.35 TRINITY_DN10777_c0_g1_i1:165-998(-)